MLWGPHVYQAFSRNFGGSELQVSRQFAGRFTATKKDMRLLRLPPRRPTGLVIRPRCLSSRAQRVLSALDLPIDDQPISGVFDGEWYGRGDLLESFCPATGEVIGRVRGVISSFQLE